MVPFSQTSTWTANYNGARGIFAQEPTENDLFERVRDGSTPFRAVKRECVLYSQYAYSRFMYINVLENM